MTKTEAISIPIASEHVVKPDFTHFFDLADSKSKQLVKDLGLGKIKSTEEFIYTFEGDVELSILGDDEILSTLPARASVCYCGRQEFLSGTFRISGKPWKTFKDDNPRSAPPTPDDLSKKLEEHSSFKASTFIPPDCRLSFQCVCDALWEEMQSITRRGLLLLSGGTGTGKSEIARGLLHRMLKEEILSLKPGRIRPHVVTYEDPIESLLITEETQILKEVFDYTPRQKKKDVAGLSVALKDSLRQTPAIFYVGEIRELEDWRAIIEYAATGHFVIATAHAGSVSEALGRILESTNATTSVSRGFIADRIFGVVHLKAFSSGGVKSLVPSAWLRKSESVPTFIANGLSALEPSRYEYGKSLLSPGEWQDDNGSSQIEVSQERKRANELAESVDDERLIGKLIQSDLLGEN